MPKVHNVFLSKWRFRALLGLTVGLVALAFLLGRSGPHAPAPAATAAQQTPLPPPQILRGGERQLAVASLNRLPMYFEPNAGQADSSVQFISRGLGYALALAGNQARFSLYRHGAGGVERSQLVARLEGANPAAAVAGEQALPGHSNYLLGNDQSRWHTGISQYARVRYQDIYPGIDVVYYGNQRQLEYDFVARPGADPAAIALSFEGAQGIDLDGSGRLHVHTAAGDLIQEAPVAYQTIGGARHNVPARFTLDRGTVRLALADYDHASQLVIDPILQFAVVTGDPGDFISGVAVQGGNMYVASVAYNLGFPASAGAYQTANLAGEANNGSSSMFLTKVDVSTTTPKAIYATFLGGHPVDCSTLPASGVASPGCNGYVYTPSASSSSSGGQADRHLCQVSSAVLAARYGSSSSSSSSGSSSSGSSSGSSSSSSSSGANVNIVEDQPAAIALDADGDLYVTGCATSSNFPTKIPVQNTNNAIVAGGSNAVAAVLNNKGDSLLFATYYGGSNTAGGTTVPADTGTAIAVGPLDSNNKYPVIVGGSTNTTDFTVTDSTPAPSATGQNQDGFVLKLDVGVSTNAASRIYAVRLGGSRTDMVSGVAVDASGHDYAAGSTSSADFPVTGSALQGQYNGVAVSTSSGTVYPFNGFVTELDVVTGPPATVTVNYSTYLGGSGNGGTLGDQINGIGLDGSGHVYVAGAAGSKAALITTTGTGSCAGSGSSSTTGFPVTCGAFQTTNKAAANGGINAFVTELDPAASGTGSLVFSSLLGGGGVSGLANAGDAATAIALDSTGNIYVAGYSQSTDYPVYRYYQGTNLSQQSGGSNVVISELAPGGASLVYSTYVGGTGNDVAYALAVDSDGFAYVGGKTSSSNFANGSGVAGGASQAFVLDMGPEAPPKIQLSIAANSTSSSSSSSSSGGSSSSSSSGGSTACPAGSGSSGGGASIATCGSATLTWSALNATSCQASGNWSGTEPVGGTYVVSPGAVGSYTYTLTCSNPVGSATASQSLTVTQGPPQVVLTLSPSQINPGGTALLGWSVNNATSCTATGWNDPTSGTTGLSLSGGSAAGSLQLSPAATSSYGLSCTGAGGTTIASPVQLSVIDLLPSVSLRVTDGNNNALSASPTLGDSFYLRWDSTNVSSCAAHTQPADTTWNGAVPTSSSAGVQVTPTLTGVITFAISCSSSQGSVVGRSVAVQVNPKPAPAQSSSKGGSAGLDLLGLLLVLGRLRRRSA